MKGDDKAMRRVVGEWAVDSFVIAAKLKGT